MLKAQISKLKSGLSGYLKKVRAGQRIIVLDRDVPVAQIIPIRKRKAGLEIRKATKSFPNLSAKRRSIKLKGGRDIVEAIREDRDER
jgi:prevent-host-death family protein